MKSLQEYLMEAIANGRFKVSPVVNKIIKKPEILKFCKELESKLETLGFKDIHIEPDKWAVFDIEPSEPTGGRYIVLPLNSNAGDGDIYMAEYNCDAIQQFDKEFNTKETGRFVLYDVVDVTSKFGNVPEHIHVYAQNHVGSSRGVKFNNPNFVLAIPVTEIQELWDKFND